MRKKLLKIPGRKSSNKCRQYLLYNKPLKFKKVAPKMKRKNLLEYLARKIILVLKASPGLLTQQ
jgi:hypothetical protein